MPNAYSNSNQTKDCSDEQWEANSNNLVRVIQYIDIPNNNDFNQLYDFIK